MTASVFELQANICKVFSHPKRLEVLCELKTGEKSFTELQAATGLSKSNLSQHLRLLRDRGVIEARREGQNMYFAVANPKITEACQLMHEVLCEQLEARQRIAAEQ